LSRSPSGRAVRPAKTVRRDRGAASSWRPSARRSGESSVTNAPVTAAASPIESPKEGWAAAARSSGATRVPAHSATAGSAATPSAPAPRTSGFASNAASSRRATQRSSTLKSIQATPHLLPVRPRADRGQKRLLERSEVLGPSARDDATAALQYHLVADAFRECELLRGDEHARAAVGERPQRLAQDDRRFRIECRSRLVDDDKGTRERERRNHRYDASE